MNLPLLSLADEGTSVFLGMRRVEAGRDGGEFFIHFIASHSHSNCFSLYYIIPTIDLHNTLQNTIS
jgi:hypothetical protein